MSSFDAIQTEITAMLDYAAEVGEGLTPDQILQLENYIEELAGQEAAKVDRFAYFIRKLEAQAEFLETEKKHMGRKQETAERNIAFLKSRYLRIMEASGLKKVAGNAHSISVRPTSSVVIEKEDELPDNYWRKKIEREPDKKAIAAAVRSGLTVPGARVAKGATLQIH